MDVQGLLEKTELFSKMAPRSLRAVAEICIPKKIAKGQPLFLEGQEGHSAYILAAGVVQLHKTAPDGREVVIKIVREGEIFAEIVLFEKTLYPVSASALQTSVLLMLPRLQFDCHLTEESFRRDFMGMLMEKQRYLTERILFLTARDVEERFFIFLRERYGKRDEYNIGMGKKDVAAAIGTIPETFSRLIRRLRKDGTVEWKGGTLTLRKNFWRDQNTV